MLLFRLIFLLISASFFLAVTATALAGFLVLTGSPKPCVDRALSPAPLADAALQANWYDVLSGVYYGQTLPLSLTEEQASALGEAYLEDKDVPIDDVRVYFCPDGSTEVMGKLRYAGLSSDVKGTGYLDTAGLQPRIELVSVEAGRVPASVSEKLLNAFLDEERVLTLPLAFRVASVEVYDGEAILVLAP